MLDRVKRGLKIGRKTPEAPPDIRYIADENTLSDSQFIAACYDLFLRRPPDSVGEKHYRSLLRQGQPRIVVIQQMMGSEEFRRLMSQEEARPLPELLGLRPDNYQVRHTQDDHEEWRVFKVLSPADYDWLESLIFEHGYYERENAWAYELNQDQRTTAEIAANFAPGRCLEIGCFTGGVLMALREKGVAAEGVEVSHMAMAKAYPEVRPAIRFGDLLELGLEPAYDLILGMDVFEHLNPNRLDAYLKECRRLLGRGGGYLMVNLPAYGEDEVFGIVHPYRLADWEVEASTQGIFSVLHADAEGWPVNGHLIWASTDWWQERFQAAGLKREPLIEQAMHARYDEYYRAASPSRLSFYVFSWNRTAEDSRRVSESFTPPA